MTTRTAAVNPSEEDIAFGPIQVRFLLTGNDTNGAMSVFEFRVAAGAKIPAPTHENDEYEEMIYGLEGVLTWTVAGQPIEVGPGDALCIPRETSHRFDNFGSADALQLSVVTPAIMGPAYFREVKDAMASAAGGPPDISRMVAIFKRNGMTIAAPPPTH